LDYKDAENRGYFKIDCLNVNIYKEVKSEQELVELMIQQPDWDMLEDKKIVDNLFHLNGHFNIVSKLQPKSIEQLAAVLAIIRPAKRQLMYKDWHDIMKQVWVKPTDGSYFFKKSHAVAYAQAIVVQMNLIQKHKYSFDAESKT
jgi:DNA polymerase III alpha subunit